MNYSHEQLQNSGDEAFKQASLGHLGVLLAVGAYPGYPEKRLHLPAAPENALLPDGVWWVKQDRAAYEALDEPRPLHPWLNEMITDPSLGVVCGKGFYWNWGANNAADPIVIRRDLETPHVLLIQRGDTGQWALPGGFINDNETGLEAAKREAFEESGIDLDSLEPVVRHIYQGPVADIRTTAHAWAETDAWAFEIPALAASSLKEMSWRGSDDAVAAAWVSLHGLQDTLFGSHSLLIGRALET